MRKRRKGAVFLAAAAMVAGMAAPATTAAAATGREGAGPPASVAFSPGSGQSAVDWNRELITILGTAGGQAPTGHPTPCLGAFSAGQYHAGGSIHHSAP